MLTNRVVCAIEELSSEITGIYLSRNKVVSKYGTKKQDKIDRRENIYCLFNEVGHW